ncbi:MULTISPECIES: hypothetical protein [unclassified Pseudomonas]|uniref:hypothetical protein n=1 Tax=unclassified Pseudomonas TaxID=196821 RepID=UPI001BD139E2|nr:hypothetical protein [Pseudomonas sp. Pc102]BBP82892.1 hypothetical protein PHLH8_25340 [Pseudomonas sp. Pc102]
MRAGLQIWDASGRQLLDTDDRTGLVLGFVDTGGVSGSRTVQGPPGQVFFFSLPRGSIQRGGKTARVVVENRTISWSYIVGRGEYAVPVRIIYGVR